MFIGQKAGDNLLYGWKIRLLYLKYSIFGKILKFHLNQSERNNFI